MLSNLKKVESHHLNLLINDLRKKIVHLVELRMHYTAKMLSSPYHWEEYFDLIEEINVRIAQYKTWMSWLKGGK